MGNTENSNVIPKKKTSKYIKSVKESANPIFLLDNLIKIHFANEKFLDLTKLNNQTIIDKPLTSISAEIQPNEQTTCDLNYALLTKFKTVLNSPHGSDIDWIIKGKELLQISASISLICLNNKHLAEVNIKRVSPVGSQPKLETETEPVNFALDRFETLSEMSFDSDLSEVDKFRLSRTSSLADENVPKRMTLLRNESTDSFNDFQNFDNQIKANIDLINKYLKSIQNQKLADSTNKKINQIHDLVFNFVDHKDEQINKLKEKFSQEKKEQKKKFSKLESHFQRRLGGMESQKNEKQSILEENLQLKKKINRLTSLIKKQEEITKELYSCLNTVKN
ncbi:phage infection protein [Anaeramoeba ignava]|uniref:Phage infection protein n=1 Tax=Anaeramoeba ignava TaxID=1746090 RepID=A0A9Q0R7K7_ANAIG|nr:phage infection protein [Anaeramoeba ignava]